MMSAFVPARAQEMEGEQKRKGCEARAQAWTAGGGAKKGHGAERTANARLHGRGGGLLHGAADGPVRVHCAVQHAAALEVQGGGEGGRALGLWVVEAVAGRGHGVGHLLLVHRARRLHRDGGPVVLPAVRAAAVQVGWVQNGAHLAVNGVRGALARASAVGLRHQLPAQHVRAHIVGGLAAAREKGGSLCGRSGTQGGVSHARPERVRGPRRAKAFA